MYKKKKHKMRTRRTVLQRIQQSNQSILYNFFRRELTKEIDNMVIDEMVEYVNSLS